MIRRHVYETIVYDSIEEMQNSIRTRGLDSDKICRYICNPDGTATLYLEYDGDAQELCPGPKQLPPHIHATYGITLKSEEVNDLGEIINNYKEYWPGMEMRQFGVSQKIGEEASAAIVLMNFEPEEDDAVDYDEEEEIIVL